MNFDFMMGVLFLLCASILSMINPSLAVFPVSFVVMMFLLRIIERLDLVILELKNLQKGEKNWN